MSFAILRHTALAGPSRSDRRTGLNMQMTTDLRPLFLECLAGLEDAFRVFEAMVPSPKLVERNGERYFRYREQTIHQGLVLKLARYISGLHAVDALLQRGLLQEQGAIHRILDEVREDIAFRAVAVTKGPVTPLHERYLAAFWTEADPHKRAKKPDTPLRKNIRSYVVNSLLQVADPSAVHDAGESVSAAYSGYVHASGANIMDLYGGDPP